VGVTGIAFQGCLQPRVGALHQERDLAQRAPSARAGIPGYLHECAQTFSDARAKSAMFSGDFETCDGSKNRRLRQCKISIREVLISVRLNVRGEVAEGGGLLNADQHFGHRRFSSQILAFQSRPPSTDLAAVGSGSAVLAPPRDNCGDSFLLLAQDGSAPSPA
jgi:hypothetical protein